MVSSMRTIESPVPPLQTATTKNSIGTVWRQHSLYERIQILIIIIIRLLPPHNLDYSMKLRLLTEVHLQTTKILELESIYRLNLMVHNTKTTIISIIYCIIFYTSHKADLLHVNGMTYLFHLK